MRPGVLHHHARIRYQYRTAIKNKMLYTGYCLEAGLAIYLSLIAVSVQERKLIQELKGLRTRLKRQLPNDEIHRNALSVAAHIRKYYFNTASTAGLL